MASTRSYAGTSATKSGSVASPKLCTRLEMPHRASLIAHAVMASTICCAYWA